MAANDYHFVTRWQVVGTAAEVADVLEKAEEYPRWWPSVYREVEVVAPGQDHGIGKTVDLVTKGWLPYTLRWRLTVTESRHPNGFTIEADGDFTGRGVWSFEPAGAWVDITFDWEVRAEKPLLALFSPVARPLFEANHRWAMQRGEESLVLELTRRRASTAERAGLPDPPPPSSSAPFLLGAAAAAFLAVEALRRASRRKRRRRGCGRG